MSATRVLILRRYPTLYMSGDQVGSHGEASNERRRVLSEVEEEVREVTSPLFACGVEFALVGNAYLLENTRRILVFSFHRLIYMLYLDTFIWCIQRDCLWPEKQQQNISFPVQTRRVEPKSWS